MEIGNRLQFNVKYIQKIEFRMAADINVGMTGFLIKLSTLCLIMMYKVKRRRNLEVTKLLFKIFKKGSIFLMKFSKFLVLFFCK